MEQTFRSFANHGDVAYARRNIAADAGVHSLVLVSVRETRHRFTTQFDVTVRGHPRRIREYRDARKLETSLWRDDVISALVLVGFVIPAVQKLKRKWQGRHDPPITAGEELTPSLTAFVVWSPQAAETAAEERLGHVHIDALDQAQLGGREITGDVLPTVDPSELLPLSFAKALASEHGYTLVVTDSL